MAWVRVDATSPNDVDIVAAGGFWPWVALLACCMYAKGRGHREGRIPQKVLNAANLGNWIGMHDDEDQDLLEGGIRALVAHDLIVLDGEKWAKIVSWGAYQVDPGAKTRKAKSRDKARRPSEPSHRDNGPPNKPSFDPSLVTGVRHQSRNVTPDRTESCTPTESCPPTRDSVVGGRGSSVARDRTEGYESEAIAQIRRDHFDA